MKLKIPPPVEQRVEAVLRQTFKTSSPESTALLRQRMQVVEAAAAYLVEWSYSPNLAIAMLLSPLLDDGNWEPEVFQELVPEAYALAGEYQVWKRLVPSLPSGRTRETPPPMQRLQKLFLASYQNEAIAFMAIAEMLSQLDQIPVQGIESKQAIIRDAEVVLLPILERYGLWALHRHVTERVFEHSVSNKRATITELVNAGEERRQRILDEVTQRLQPLLPQDASVRLHPLSPARLFHRALSYEEQNSIEDAQEMLHRAATRLMIDVVVDSEPQCYVALGATHQIWRPISTHFNDHIGSPRFNGYRAIHTLVNVNPAPDFSANVGFLICSREMERINLWGRIEENRRGQQEPRVNAWWNRIDNYLRLLEIHTMGQYSDPTYVFSPHGEIYELVRYATPLDFAFAVHSDLGSTFRGAIVNGQAVDPDFTLANGDIVTVVTGPTNGASSRASWLSHVRSASAAKHLRREFSRQRSHTNKGRELINNALKRWCDEYGISFSEVRQESYLIQIAKRWSIGDLESFYTAVASGHIEPEAIANHIISLELSHRIGYQDGTPLTVRYGRMRIAHCCRPSINDDIVGRFTQPDTKHERVKIHRADCPNVKGVPVQALSWREVDYKGLYEYVATGYDRKGVLIDVLDPFYGYGAYLHKVQAERLRDETAQFILLAELGDPNAAKLIESNVKSLSEIVDCTMRPLTLSPKEMYGRKKKLGAKNPFHYNLPARKKFEFVGRQAELQRLKELIAAREEWNQVVVRGPWKVGKSSLLEYVAEHDQAEFDAVAVLVDCHKIPNLSLQTLLEEVIRKIGERIEQNVELLGSYQIALGTNDFHRFPSNPIEGFSRFLRHVRPVLDSGERKRLVIMIDEFSDLYDDVRQGKIDSSIFRNLRGLFERELDVMFVMVVQAAAFNQMQEQESMGAELLERAQVIPLGSLDDESIQDLLHRRIRLLDLYCGPEALRRVLLETGGNPYVANILCHAIVENLKETGETEVTLDQIDHAIEEILGGHGATYFRHLTSLVGNQSEKALLRILSNNELPAYSMEDIGKHVPFRNDLSLADMDRALGNLLVKGLLSGQSRDEANLTFRLQIPLFARWLRESFFSAPEEDN